MRAIHELKRQFLFDFTSLDTFFNFSGCKDNKEIGIKKKALLLNEKRKKRKKDSKITDNFSIFSAQSLIVKS